MLILADRNGIFKCQTYEEIKCQSNRGAWMAQLVKCLTSAQVMISWFMDSGPVSGSMLTVQSLEPTSDFAYPSLSLSLP